MVIDNNTSNPTDNNFWHTDVTFIETPPMGALLYAEQLPTVGGDTMWASMTAAYRALSAPMQAFLSGLEAVHSFEHAFGGTQAATRRAGEVRPRRSRPTRP
jgi:taurine dioxygenase